MGIMLLLPSSSRLLFLMSPRSKDRAPDQLTFASQDRRKLWSESCLDSFVEPDFTEEHHDPLPPTPPPSPPGIDPSTH